MFLPVLILLSEDETVQAVAKIKRIRYSLVAKWDGLDFRHNFIRLGKMTQAILWQLIVDAALEIDAVMARGGRWLIMQRRRLKGPLRPEEVKRETLDWNYLFPRSWGGLGKIFTGALFGLHLR
jgi:hypothetical protein